jgi:hypothetical protein
MSFSKYGGKKRHRKNRRRHKWDGTTSKSTRTTKSTKTSKSC